MHTGTFLFAQLMAFLPKRDFDRCVRKYRGNYRTRKFSCLLNRTHLLAEQDSAPPQGRAGTA